MKILPITLHLPLSSLTAALMLLATGAAQSAVIDLFSEGPQLLESTGPSQVTDTVTMAGSAFPTRTLKLVGAGQSLVVTTDSRELSYSFASGNSQLGGFYISYGSESGNPANLIDSGETGILLRFEEVNLQGQAMIDVSYYSTLWKGMATAVLSGKSDSEEVFLPFSAFPSKPGAFASVTALYFTVRQLNPGDSLTIAAIATVPEPSACSAVALAAALFLGKRRR